MVIRKEDKVQSPLFFAIIDEVDSILIDEARTPLIISMPDNEPTSKYSKFAVLAKELKDTEHYKVDEKQKTATLTEE
jgi:preprotein translocase subunit SecA